MQRDGRTPAEASGYGITFEDLSAWTFDKKEVPSSPKIHPVDLFTSCEGYPERRRTLNPKP